ncbi:hypothetical protein ACMGDH_14355 [Sphingomonas sp. DT-207]|uniref:hypothetical protein n=1 Tax=Sphingomonas sp. DT-207 TaxID=3396167 RepID=UPI003F1B0CF0
MKKSLAAVLLAGSMSLAACTSTTDDSTLAAAGTGAAVGGAGGAVVGAIAGAPIAGAVIGAAVGGIAGAVWADANNDGQADGYVSNGQYYPGAPAGYTATRNCRSVGGTAATGAGVGAIAGAGVGALAGDVLAGAVIGALVGGVGGAVWADANNDGCADGYTQNGQYYEGVPPSYQSAPPAAERG